MHRTIRAAIAALALLALPQFASAGPIQWGYRAVGPNGGVLAEKTGLTDLIWSDSFMPNPRSYGTPVPDPNFTGLETNIKRAEATVIITDENSGQSATFGLFYEYVEQYEINPDGSREPIFAGFNSGLTGDNAPAPWEEVPFILGGNTYKIRTNDNADLVAHIELGQTAATPEPGTLALAALGTFGLGIARRIRRA